MLIKRKKLANSPRHPQQGKVSTQATQLEIHKAKQEAKAITEEAQRTLAESKKRLEEAQKKAHEIINQAESDAEDIKRQVYEEAVVTIREENDLLREQAKQLFKEVFQVKREALMQAHKEIIKIALDLAEKIIRYQANIDSNILKTQVVEAIKKATSESERVQVFVNPADLQKLEEMIPEIEKLFPAGVDIVALSNESVDLGSCIIETKSGQLDARFSTQLMTLIGLCEHLEVPEPQIEVSEEINVGSDVALKSFEELNDIHESSKLKETILEHEKELLEVGLLTEEEEKLKNELLSDEGSVAPETLQELEPLYQNPELVIEEEPIIELQEPEYIEETVQKVTPQQKAEKIEPLIIDEPELEELLDEDLEDLYEYEDEEEVEEDKFEAKNVLKPKKKPSSEISDIAKEMEKNPEWKNILDEE